MWIDGYRVYNDIPNTLILVGNKADHPESTWKISRADLEMYARHKKCRHFLTDCITGQNIEETFNRIAINILSTNKSILSSMNNILDVPEIKLDKIRSSRFSSVDFDCDCVIL